MSLNKNKIITFCIILLILSATPLIAYAIFSEGHSTYKTKTNSTDLCDKCHSNQTTAVGSGEHKPANCICHGYNPNSTAPNQDYNINETHDLRTQVYCTSCHSKYDNITGDITIHTAPTVSGLNQSGHYLMNANATSVDALYNHSAQQFK
jgi:nitrate/TMAO reductase-like tetraheme cytochrome c subunit